MPNRKKICKSCGRMLPLESFFRRLSVKDGRVARCRECLSEERKERLKDPKIRAKRVAYSKMWNNSPGGRRYHRNYKQTKEYKQKELLRRKAFRNIDKIKARYAVKDAVKYGRLKKNPCAICGKKGTEAHHILGYAPEHRIEVIWLCKLHHQKVEERIRNERERNNIST